MNRFVLPVFGLALCGIAGAVYFRVQGENNALKMSNMLYQSENRLLKDQLSETEFKMQSARTYEEGLTDGLMRSNNRGYTDGYHAAMNQVAEEKIATEDKKKSSIPPAKIGNQ